MITDGQGAALVSALTAALGGAVRRRVVPDAYTLGATRLLLEADDVPVQGVKTWASCGLAELTWEDLGFEHRVEVLVGGAVPELGRVAGILASHVASQRWFPAPGRVLREAVRLAALGEASDRLPHLYLEHPFPWDESAWLLRAADLVVIPVFGFPISEAECAWREAHGPEAFGELLEREEVSVFDLERPSAV